MTFINMFYVLFMCLNILRNECGIETTTSLQHIMDLAAAIY